MSQWHIWNHMNWGTCFGNLKIDYENSLFRLAYNPPLDLNALNFWVKFHNLVMEKGSCDIQKKNWAKLCLYCHIIKNFFLKSPYLSSKWKFGNCKQWNYFWWQFWENFGNMCCSMKKIFQQKNPHFWKKKFLKKKPWI